jgi:hypothetical protein
MIACFLILFLSLCDAYLLEVIAGSVVIIEVQERKWFKEIGCYCNLELLRVQISSKHELFVAYVAVAWWK